MGQAGGMYLVIEDDEGVKLLDQHALHERLLFEDLLARARAHAPVSQRLLVPETVELNPAQAAAFADPLARAALAALGFDLAEFGPRAAAVQALPQALKSASAAPLLRELLDALGELTEDAPARRLDPALLREKSRLRLLLQSRRQGRRAAQRAPDARPPRGLRPPHPRGTHLPPRPAPRRQPLLGRPRTHGRAVNGSSEFRGLRLGAWGLRLEAWGLGLGA
ncbi:MAG: hypothetical protein M5U26_10810 [Planctomycetota bacterium]|nr:hypothetical protein [Planctomycetota bacterium]